jgi:hypothetical protein
MARITPKQRKVAKLLIENATLDKPLNGGQIVENSGYGESMKLYPARVIDTIGVEKALEEYGFTEDNAKRVVTDILLNPEADNAHRLKAASEVFKVKGSYAAEKTQSVNLNLQGHVDSNGMEALRQEYEEKLKAKLLNG